MQHWSCIPCGFPPRESGYQSTFVRDHHRSCLVVQAAKAAAAAAAAVADLAKADKTPKPGKKGKGKK